jgi:hypothetical protein
MSGTSGELLGNNLFAYCFNNPVNFSDNEGNWPSWATKLIIGTAVIAAAAVLTVATAGTGTALACFAAGALKGAIVGAATGALSGAATGAVSHLITEGTFDGIGEAMLEGAADGYMMGAITGFISGGLTSNQCFVAGTAILTSIGYVSIQNIEAGDWVWASDLETGETELKQVVQTFVNEATELVHLTVNGEEIISTMEHPFYSPVKGWTAACKLRAGDILVMLNGEYVVVEQVQHELLETPIAVYNFEVDGFHTYYVGSTSILVHNLCVTDKIDDTYNQLKATHKGSGKEIHHIVEKRFADTLNVKKGDMLSIALDKADHRVFTKLWRDALPYGKKYTVDQIWQAAQDVYKNYPILLDAAKRTIFG